MSILGNEIRKKRQQEAGKETSPLSGNGTTKKTEQAAKTEVSAPSALRSAILTKRAGGSIGDTGLTVSSGNTRLPELKTVSPSVSLRSTAPSSEGAIETGEQKTARGGSFGSGGTKVSQQGGFSGGRESQQSVGERIAKTLKGAAAGYAGSLYSAVGGLQQLGSNNPADRAIEILMQAADEDTAKSEVIQQARAAEEARAKRRADSAEALRQRGRDLSGYGQRQIEAAKSGLGSVGGLLVDTGVGGAQLAADIGLGAFTGLGMLPVMTARSFGGGVEEAAADGADLTGQLRKGMGSAAVSYATEQISNVAFAGLKAVKPGITDDFLEKSISAMAQKLASSPQGVKTLEALGKLGVSFSGEFSEEFIESFLDPYVTRLAYDPDAETVFQNPELLGDYLYDGLVGGILGAVGGGVELAMQSRAGRTNGQSGAQQTETEPLLPLLPQYEESVDTLTREEGPSPERDAARPAETWEEDTSEALRTESREEATGSREEPLEQLARETAEEQQKAAQTARDEAESAFEDFPNLKEYMGEEGTAQQMEQQTGQAAETDAAEAPLLEALTGGKRIDSQALTRQQIQEWGEHQDTVWMDAGKRVYQMDPGQHISQRTTDSVRSRTVNAFQFDHPELRRFYKQAAQELVKDAALSLDTGRSARVERTMQGKRYIQEILDSPSLRSAMDLGLSRPQIIKAAEDLIADHGQENNAAAKRLEMVLDEMLTEGFTTVEGKSFAPDQAYIAAKAKIPGYVESVKEELPLWDIQEETALQEAEQRAVQAAYEAGRANVPAEAVQLEGEAQINAYTAGRQDYIREDMAVEKPAGEEYTGGAEDDIAARVSEKERKRAEVMEKYGITEDESWAVTEYKTAEAYKVNAKLREGIELNDVQKRMVEQLDSALEKLPTVTGPVYRTLSFDDIFEAQEEYEAFLSGHAAGNIVHYESYTSASNKRDGHPVADGTKYGITLEMASNTARSLDGFGNNFESEVLFARDTSFLVREVTEKNGYPYIYIEEVTENGEAIHSEERSAAVQRLQESHPVHSDVQGVSEGDTAGNQERKLGSPTGVSRRQRDSVRAKGPEQDRSGATSEKQGAVTEKAAESASSPQRSIAEDVLKYVRKGQDFSAARLFEIADKHYGGTMAEGTYTVKDAYDAMELAVNLYLVEADFVKAGNGSADTAKATLKQLVELLKHIPTQTKRTAEMESFQQFSTPPNIAYLAAWSANVASSDVVLEPSAGIGGLALWPKAWGAKVYGNELSERRLAFLNELGLDGTFRLNAEQIDNLLPDSIRPSVVIMNPPFSSTAGRTSKNDTANAKRHIQQALDRLEDGGRLVAILGNGMTDDAPAFRAWWDELRQENSIRANIRLDGENYRKYGTTFDVQLVVMDKIGPQMGSTLTGTFRDLSQVPGMMEVIRNDRARKTGARGILPDGDIVSGRDTNTGDDLGRAERPEHSAGASAAVHGGGKQRRKAGARNSAERDGRANGRGDGGPAVRGDSGRSGDQKTGQSGTGELGGDNAGARMALSGSTERDLDRGTSGRGGITENPDSVYAAYAPKKVHIEGAKKHPAKLVESAAMAAVEPPDVTYTPHLPARLAQEGLLSDAQLENIVYAGQAHEQTLPNGQRKGYFIGDGTGVGKGRQLSGIIMDNFQQGRDRAIWISNSANLYEDAVRDWTDLGGKKEDVLSFGKVKLGQDIQAARGILFSTYDTLKVEKDGKSRLKDLERWLGKDFDGVICFDEAHNMANATGRQGKRGKTKPSAKALAGIKLQQMFPKARVVYASATGATDIGDYAYLERLGLWGPGTAFHDANDFTAKISTGGLAAMELVARDMKSMGVYMARSISYDDVTYDTLQHDLNPMQTEIYNTMSRAWQTVYQNMSKALEVTGANLNGNARGAAHSVFYGTQQRFYNQIIISMSMPSVIEDMRRELANGRSCILQIVNTNEAQADRAISAAEKAGLSLEDMDLTPSETLVEMVRKSFPIQEYEAYTDDNGNKRSRPVVDAAGEPVLSKKAIRMRDELIADLQQMKVPDGPMEMLFDAFGADTVAEVTGRGRRVVEKADENGQMRRVVEKRSSNAGVADAQMFQDGKKRILVFSDAGGTGKSYHADLRAKNQQQRVHYLLQPGWNASKATQGFGRSHRSNQAVAPIFRLVTTNVMGQKRFTSTIARRLDQLGALTKGQRQAGSGIFGEKDNLEGPIAQDALQQYYKTLSADVLKKLGLYSSLYDSSGKLNEGSPDLRDIGKFLNRILTLEVDEQNEVFQGFYDTFDRMMDVAIANGTVDMGLENYRADKIEVKDEKVIRKDPSGADTKYVQMQVFNKPELISLAKAKKLHQNFQGIVRTEDGSVRAVYEISSKTNPRTGEVQRRFKLEGPVKGKTSVFVESTMKEQTKPIDQAEWAQAWKDETAKAPKYNESTLHMLTGTLLPIWDRLPANNTRVMRVLSSDGRQYLGRVIRGEEIDMVLKTLGANRTMQTYTPQQISASVLGQGKEALFRDNKLRLVRRRVSGEWRMELTGQNVWYMARQFPDLITERINYEYRYFVPTGKNGEAMLKRIMEQNPVVDVRDAAPTGEVDRMINGTAVDHSGEWTAGRVGDRSKNPKRLAEILEDIRHDFGLNITTGHIRGANVRGQYNQRDHGIRTRIAQDLPTVAHELGHHLDRTFGLRNGISQDMRRELLDNMDPQLAAVYRGDELLGEGIAEYVRRFLQNRETAAIDYPLFTDYFLGSFSGRDLFQIEQLADEINAYYSLDADTATSHVRLREEKGPDARTATEKIKARASVLAQAWLDSNQGIKEFDRATGANTYKLASNAAYSDAIAGQIIVGDLTDANGQYVAPGLKTALHGLDLHNKEEYRLFGEYLTVKHGPERLAEGMRIFAEDTKNSTAWMKRRQNELELEYPQFAEISERLYEFQQQFLQTWGVETGLVSSDSAQEWAKRWQYYVPLNRAVSEDRRGGGAKRGFANQNSTIKRARGSGLDVVHPVDNIINNVVKMVNAGVRNNVMRRITDQAVSLEADASFLEQIPTPMVRRGFRMDGVKADLSGQLHNSGMDDASLDTADQIVAGLDDILYQYGRGKAHGDVVTVMKNGKQEFWKINDPQLLASITSMSPKSMDGILDAYAVVSRFMTSNITGNNVVWSLFSNFPRDMMTMFSYSKVKNPLKVFPAMGSAYINKLKGDNADPLYKEYLAMGGGKTSAYTSDRNLAKKARESLAGKKFEANPLEWIAFVSDTVEMGPRFATYKMLRNAGMDPQEAFFEAMDVTVNFRKGGRIAREINKVVPFFNANVQGLDKFRRWITAEDADPVNRKKAIRSRTLAYFAVSAALAALAYGINSTDEEKEKDYEQLSNYTKNSFWNIPIGDGKYFSIPKPRELGVLSSFMETCMEYGIGENDHAFDEFYSYAVDNFLPSIASDVAQIGQNGLLETGMGILGNFGVIGVVGYLGANRDFLGKPIVSSGLQNLEPKDQYTERTSKIAYELGQAFNASPAQIDYFFQQVLGGWWKYQKALFPVGRENVDYTLGVRNTYIKDNQYSTDLVNWLYDKADDSSKAKASDPGSMDKAITAKMDGSMTTFYSRYYALAKNKAETTASRSTRQTVLDMIQEYRKTADSGELTALQRAVYAVCDQQGSTDLLPSVMQSEVKDGDGKKHTLSAAQYVEYQTDYLRLYWEYAEDGLGGQQTAAEKAAILKAAKSTAQKQATDRALSRIGASKTDFSEKYKGVSANDIVTFTAQIDLADDDGLKQDEVIDILQGMIVDGLSYDDAYTLFHSRYESDKNNPWSGYR